MHLNNQYIRNGDIDIKKLFLLENITKEVISDQNTVKENIIKLKEIVSTEKEPKMPVEMHCINCEHSETCGIEALEENNIFTIRGNGIRSDKKWELYRKNIISFEDLLESGYPLNKNQRLQVETEAKKLPDHIDKDAIKKFLKTVTYPLYFLDFETYDTIIPEYDGMHPYMKIPFQFSLHILIKKNAPLQHKEYLAEIKKDPRRYLAEKLCEYIPDNVCVLAYHMSFEKGVIARLAELFGDLKNHLLKINENMRDLIIPFRSKSYYCRTMSGSYSIKAILPALFPPNEYPELDYDKLENVHNGGDAMNLFPELPFCSSEEIKMYRRQLLEYCCLDTLAMVRVLEKLQSVVQ
jgi:predicted RecB family nuclease